MKAANWLLRGSLLNRLILIVRVCWNYLREVSGENDYERYLKRVRNRGGDPMTAEQFYLAKLNQKHSRINRCC